MAMREVEFRDGERLVPEHVYHLLAKIETWTLTYDQAIKLANDQMTKDHLNKIQKDMVADHLGRFG